MGFISDIGIMKKKIQMNCCLILSFFTLVFQKGALCNIFSSMSLYTTYTDEQLLSLLKHSEEKAFTEIYNRYWDKLLAIAFNHTRNKSVAKDIVQNLFVGLWNRRDQLQVDSLEHYLATAIKFAVFKEYYRKQKREAGLIAKLTVSEEVDIEEQVNAKFLEQYIYGIVEQLPPKCRLVFKYSRVRHLNIREIANEMGIAQKTVEAHLTKALKTIRQELRESGLLIILFILSCAFLA